MLGFFDVRSNWKVEKLVKRLEDGGAPPLDSQLTPKDTPTKGTGGAALQMRGSAMISGEVSGATSAAEKQMPDTPQMPRTGTGGASLQMPGKESAALGAGDDEHMPEPRHLPNSSGLLYMPGKGTGGGALQMPREAASGVGAEKQIPALRTPAPSKDLEENAAEAKRILNCPPSQASRSAFKFQNPLVFETTKFPVNDKMNQSVTGLNSKVLDYILPTIFRGRAEVELCYSDAWSELGDRIHIGALFPGLRYFTSPDQEMMAELKDCYYLVQKRDDKGNIMLGKDGEPIVVKELHEQQQRDDKKKWVVEFSTYVKNSNAAKWIVEMKPDYSEEDLWQQASLFEAKFMLEKNDLYQAGMSGCNNLIKSLRESRLVDRLYAFVGGRDEYNYSILDAFGSVDVVDNIITEHSYKRFQAHVQRLMDRLGDQFPHDSYSKLPSDLAGLQKLYDRRRAEFGEMFSGLDFPTKLRRHLVGVFYCNHSTPRAFYSGTKPVSIEEAHGFVQGLMRIHVGNNFLHWTIDKAESIFRKRLQETSENFRKCISSPLFSHTIYLSELEIRSSSELWKLTEEDEKYTIKLQTPNFSGAIRAAVSMTFGGRKVLLRVSKNKEELHGEYPFYITCPGDVDQKKLSYEGGPQHLVITCPRSCMPTGLVWELIEPKKRKEREPVERVEQSSKKLKGESLEQADVEEQASIEEPTTTISDGRFKEPADSVLQRTLMSGAFGL